MPHHELLLNKFNTVMPDESAILAWKKLNNDINHLCSSLVLNYVFFPFMLLAIFRTCSDMVFVPSLRP